jgi:hypothetical protein
MAETCYICSTRESSATTTGGVPSVDDPFFIPRLSGSNNGILEEYISMNENTKECRLIIPQDKSDQDIIHDLKQRMPRRDLMKLILCCTQPNDLGEICGDWDGI